MLIKIQGPHISSKKWFQLERQPCKFKAFIYFKAMQFQPDQKAWNTEHKIKERLLGKVSSQK